MSIEMKGSVGNKGLECKLEAISKEASALHSRKGPRSQWKEKWPHRLQRSPRMAPGRARAGMAGLGGEKPYLTRKVLKARMCRGFLEQKPP